MPPILKIRAELAIPMHTPEDLAAAAELPKRIQDYLASTPGLVVTRWKDEVVTPRKVPESCLEMVDPPTHMLTDEEAAAEAKLADNLKGALWPRSGRTRW